MKVAYYGILTSEGRLCVVPYDLRCQPGYPRRQRFPATHEGLRDAQALADALTRSLTLALVNPS